MRVPKQSPSTIRSAFQTSGDRGTSPAIEPQDQDERDAMCNTSCGNDCDTLACISGFWQMCGPFGWYCTASPCAPCG